MVAYDAGSLGGPALRHETGNSLITLSNAYLPCQAMHLLF